MDSKKERKKEGMKENDRINKKQQHEKYTKYNYVSETFIQEQQQIFP